MAIWFFTCSISPLCGTVSGWVAVYLSISLLQGKSCHLPNYSVTPPTPPWLLLIKVLPEWQEWESWCKRCGLLKPVLLRIPLRALLSLEPQNPELLHPVKALDICRGGQTVSWRNIAPGPWSFQVYFRELFIQTNPDLMTCEIWGQQR